MVYVFGIVGFILGFFVGQILLLALLKGVSNKELLHNKTIQWTYGILNWACAGIGAYVLSFLYQYYIEH